MFDASKRESFESLRDFWVPKIVEFISNPTIVWVAGKLEETSLAVTPQEINLLNLQVIEI